MASHPVISWCEVNRVPPTIAFFIDMFIHIKQIFQIIMHVDASFILSRSYKSIIEYGDMNAGIECKSNKSPTIITLLQVKLLIICITICAQRRLIKQIKSIPIIFVTFKNKREDF